MATITFRCGMGCDDITLPCPQDLDMYRDFMVAHGVMHGEDWRASAEEVLVGLVYRIAEAELARELNNE